MLFFYIYIYKPYETISREGKKWIDYKKKIEEKI